MTATDESERAEQDCDPVLIDAAEALLDVIAGRIDYRDADSEPLVNEQPQQSPEPVTFAPGVYSDMPEDVYHRDPVPGGSLSSSGARKLLPPSCPAIYKWERDNPPAPKPHFDLGSAAHKLVLGVGAEIVTIDAPDWKTKAAQEAKKAAHAAGKIPLLTDDRATVEAMATALRQHPIASALFDPERGAPEQSLFWQDAETDVWLRARLDWLPDAREGRLIVPDYKTTVSAEPTAFAKSCANYGYHCQGAFYSDAVLALRLAEEVAFVFVAQEKTAPYLVTVFELDAEALHIGRQRNRQAIEVYRDCMAADVWPGYTDEVAHISLPKWATYDQETY